MRSLRWHSCGLLSAVKQVLAKTVVHVRRQDKIPVRVTSPALIAAYPNTHQTLGGNTLSNWRRNPVFVTVADADNQHPAAILDQIDNEMRLVRMHANGR